MKRKSICIILAGCMMISGFTGCTEDKKEAIPDNVNKDEDTGFSEGEQGGMEENLCKYSPKEAEELAEKFSNSR